jgi:hypothetical protein
LGFGLLVLAAAFVGSLGVEDTPTLQRVYVSLGLLEMATAVVIVLYLVTKSTRAFDCG